MPSMDDIVSVAEALGKQPIAIMQDRCVVVRNRNAGCRRCVSVCAAEAITVSGNRIDVDTTLCTSCGACTAVCPTEAIVPLAPTDKDLFEKTAQSCSATGMTVFACARKASKRVADPSKYAEVPCLSRLDESVMLSAVASGAEGVILVDGNCATCKYRDNSARIDDVARSTDELLRSVGSAVKVERSTEFPEDFLVSDAKGLFGTSRRGFFSEAVTAAKDTASTSAKTTIATELGITPDAQSIGERLRITPDGTLPRIEMPRHEAAINALDAIGSPQVPEIDSRLFGSISIDAIRCNSCGMCATFCPTGALRRDSADSPASPLKYLEFSACDCVQCGLCVDVCWKEAITLSSRVSTEELFDFEPITFKLKK